jgi:hypothetical protein
VAQGRQVRQQRQQQEGPLLAAPEAAVQGQQAVGSLWRAELVIVQAWAKTFVDFKKSISDGKGDEKKGESKGDSKSSGGDAKSESKGESKKTEGKMFK